jgi:6-phosphofructokinase 1
MAGRLRLMDWPSVTGWVAEGGAKLGTKRAPPQEEHLPQIAQKLKEFEIQALLIIGGFEVTFLYVFFVHHIFV